MNEVEKMYENVGIYPDYRATNAWCRITNALIQKYKPMTAQDPDRALKELTRIEGALLAGRFLTEQELREAS